MTSLAEVAEHAESWIVSPFITEMPREMAIESFHRPFKNRPVHAALTLASAFAPRIRRALQDRQHLRREIVHSWMSVLVDWASEPLRLFALSQDDKRALELCRIDRSQIAKLENDPSGLDRFERFKKAGLIVPETRVTQLRFTRAAIEINRHCNYRCTFCPVSEDPLPKDSMTDALYERVLAQLCDYGISQTSLNHYNEPTLDRKFVERIRLAVEAGLNVALNTNASLLDEAKIRTLAEIGNVDVTVNLPSVDPDEYRATTQSKVLDRVLENLELLHRHQVPTSLIINAPRDAGDERVAKINDRFSEMFGDHTAWRTHSRAGHHEQEDYFSAIHHSGRLDGCVHGSSLNIAWDGRVFLCPQDYKQDFVLGDLSSHSLEEITSSEAAARLRRQLFGLEEPPSDFLCSSCALTRPLENGDPILALGTEEAPELPPSIDPATLIQQGVCWV